MIGVQRTMDGILKNIKKLPESRAVPRHPGHFLEQGKWFSIAVSSGSPSRTSGWSGQGWKERKCSGICQKAHPPKRSEETGNCLKWDQLWIDGTFWDVQQDYKAPKCGQKWKSEWKTEGGQLRRMEMRGQMALFGIGTKLNKIEIIEAITII